MKWITRRHVRVNRVATAWLIRRFVDAKAEFMFVEPEHVKALEQEEKAIGFDAPGAKFENKDGKTSFEQIVAEYRLSDPALAELARIVHAADVPGALAEAPEAAGLRAISHGFPLVSRSDSETISRGSFLYDALYAYVKGRIEGRIR
jgi:hypothetical protein